MRNTTILVFGTLALLAGCGGGNDHADAGLDAGPTMDATPGEDAGGERDAGEDAGSIDASAVVDAGPPTDGGPDDDAGGSAADAALSDAGAFDATTPLDADLPDAGPRADGGPLPFDASWFDGGGPTTHTFPPRDFVCAGSPLCATTVPLRSVADRTVTVTRDLPSVTLTSVVQILEVPEESSGAAVGFNLDALDSGAGSTAPSADCEEFNQDFTSVSEPGHVGVDNTFQSLVPTVEGLLDASDCPGGTTVGCVDAQVAAQIASGELLLIVEVTGVDSLLHDPEVQVSIHLGSVPGGGVPLLDASGLLAAGQSFDAVATVAGPVTGDIFHGRLRAELGTLMLPAATGTMLSLFPGQLDRAELRADVGPSGLTRGNLGGSTPVEWYVTEVSRIMPGIEATVRSVLESVADVTPTAADPAICADVSSGMRLATVSAVRLP
ncbi:MAG TPA: hypothetical protein RMH99_01675 [Sandaracinaceae bacterium LLY-WYZ-13_1]|nr:hypothetical protein [Sandaracinaceae bacterium LLY-WYZ-13_1]